MTEMNATLTGTEDEPSLPLFEEITEHILSVEKKTLPALTSGAGTILKKRSCD